MFSLPYSCLREFNFLNEVFSLSRNFANLIPDSQLLNCVELSKHKTLIKSVEGFADDDLFSEKDWEILLAKLISSAYNDKTIVWIIQIKKKFSLTINQKCHKMNWQLIVCFRWLLSWCNVSINVYHRIKLWQMKIHADQNIDK